MKSTCAASEIHRDGKMLVAKFKKYSPKFENKIKSYRTRAPKSKCVNTIPVMKWLIFLFLWPNSFLTLLKIKRLTKIDLLLTEDWTGFIFDYTVLFKSHTTRFDFPIKFSSTLIKSWNIVKNQSGRMWCDLDCAVDLYFEFVQLNTI